MEYNNFDNHEVESMVELHKTDYNSYADLSHFVDEYYKAQALINECNNFYRSFLKSKLLPYSKIVNSIYTQDKYKFFKYTLSENRGESIAFVKEFPILEEYQKNDPYKPWSGVYNYMSIMGLTYLATAGASFKLKEEINNDPDCPYILVTERWDDSSTNYMQSNYRVVPRNVYLKTDRNICVDLYGTLNMYRRNSYESDSEYEARKKAAYKKLGVKTANGLKDKMTPFRDELETKWLSYYTDEIIRLFKKYDVTLNVAITNNLMLDAYHCLAEYKKAHKNADVSEYDEYFGISSTPKGKKLSDFAPQRKTTNYTSVDIKVSDFVDEDTLNNILRKYVSHERFGCWGNGPVEEIIKAIDVDKLNDYITDYLSESSAVFREILMKYETNIENQKLYIIDKDNNAKYFCDTCDLPNVKINLKDRTLVCTYESIRRYKKHRFPSDCPYTVETSYTSVTFDVSDNSVASYTHGVTTHEESYNRY